MQLVGCTGNDLWVCTGAVPPIWAGWGLFRHAHVQARAHGAKRCMRPHQADWVMFYVSECPAGPSGTHLRLWRARVRAQRRNRAGHAGRRAQRVPQRQRHLRQGRALGAKLCSHACAEQRGTSGPCLRLIGPALECASCLPARAHARLLANLHARSLDRQCTTSVFKALTGALHEAGHQAGRGQAADRQSSAHLRTAGRRQSCAAGGARWRRPR